MKIISPKIIKYFLINGILFLFVYNVLLSYDSSNINHYNNFELLNKTKIQLSTYNFIQYMDELNRNLLIINNKPYFYTQAIINNNKIFSKNFNYINFDLINYSFFPLTLSENEYNEPIIRYNTQFSDTMQTLVGISGGTNSGEALINNIGKYSNFYWSFNSALKLNNNLRLSDNRDKELNNSKYMKHSSGNMFMLDIAGIYKSTFSSISVNYLMLNSTRFIPSNYIINKSQFIKEDLNANHYLTINFNTRYSNFLALNGNFFVSSNILYTEAYDDDTYKIQFDENSFSNHDKETALGGNLFLNLVPSYFDSLKLGINFTKSISNIYINKPIFIERMEFERFGLSAKAYKSLTSELSYRASIDYFLHSPLVQSGIFKDLSSFKFFASIKYENDKFINELSFSYSDEYLYPFLKDFMYNYYYNANNDIIKQFKYIGTFLLNEFIVLSGNISYLDLNINNELYYNNSNYLVVNLNILLLLNIFNFSTSFVYIENFRDNVNNSFTDVISPIQYNLKLYSFYKLGLGWYIDWQFMKLNDYIYQNHRSQLKNIESLSAGLSYTLNHSISLNFDYYNILDNNYYFVPGIYLPGRNFQIGIRVNF